MPVTRFRMNHEQGALEIVNDDDRVLRMWPAVVGTWEDVILTQTSGSPDIPFKSRAVKVVSEAGWYVVACWGTFTFSSNFALSHTVSDLEAAESPEHLNFTEEPEVVECLVCASDAHEPLMVVTYRNKALTDAAGVTGTVDTLVPYVDPDEFGALVTSAERFFDRWGPDSDQALHCDMNDLGSVGHG